MEQRGVVARSPEIQQQMRKSESDFTFKPLKPNATTFWPIDTSHRKSSTAAYDNQSTRPRISVHVKFSREPESASPGQGCMFLVYTLAPGIAHKQSRLSSQQGGTTRVAGAKLLQKALPLDLTASIRWHRKEHWPCAQPVLVEGREQNNSTSNQTGR